MPAIPVNSSTYLLGWRAQRRRPKRQEQGGQGKRIASCRVSLRDFVKVLVSGGVWGNLVGEELEEHRFSQVVDLCRMALVEVGDRAVFWTRIKIWAPGGKNIPE